MTKLPIAGKRRAALLSEIAQLRMHIEQCRTSLQDIETCLTGKPKELWLQRYSASLEKYSADLARKQTSLQVYSVPVSLYIFLFATCIIAALAVGNMLTGSSVFNIDAMPQAMLGEHIILKGASAAEIISTHVLQGAAEAGKPVLWTMDVTLAGNKKSMAVDLGKGAFNLTVRLKKPLSSAPAVSSASQQLPGASIPVPDAGEIEIEYYTEAPKIKEINITKRRKEVIVSSEEHYVNIFASAAISEAPMHAIKLYRTTGGVREAATIMNYTDANNNGLIDTISWMVPSLSNQTYEIVIVQAEHLDGNRAFISDIYPDVREKDGVWSETIFIGEYVRAVFEKNLTSVNDITLWPRIVSGSPRVIVYGHNGNESIAEFVALVNDTYNKVFLTNLQGSQDTFDLLILDGDVMFDHIVDPANPSFTTNPADSPDPVNAGSSTTFTAIATDADGDQWALYVCKTNSKPTGNPLSCPGGLWCASSNVASGSQASCSYTTTAADAGAQSYYGFPCDTTRRCGSQAGGTSFTVNVPPSVSITAPASVWYNANFVVNATVTDTNPISTVTYRYENSSTNGAWTAMSNPSGSLWNATFSVSSVSQGNYTFRINATDDGGARNSTVAVENVGIDTTAPTWVEAPSNLSIEYNNALSYDLNATDSGSGINQYYVNDTTKFAIDSATGILTNSTKLNFTEHNVLVSVNDTAGNILSQAIIVNVSDTQAPTMLLLSPSSKWYTAGFNVSLAVATADSDDISSVEYRYENSSTNSSWASLVQSTSTQWTVAVDITSISDGNYTFRVNVTDTAGNSNTTKSVSNVGIDGGVPSAILNTPVSGWYNADFVINATASDGTSLAAVQYRYENSSTNGSWTSMSNPSGSLWNATFSVSSVSNGNYTFRINATDSAGNENTSAYAADVGIDTGSPEIALESPANNSLNASTNDILFSYTASDNFSVDSCSIIINDMVNITNSSITAGISQNFTANLPNAGYNWSVNCTDGAGNIGASATYNLSINVAAQSVGLSLSDALDAGINWTVIILPASNLSADGNNGTGVTQYDVQISATGTTADLYVRGEGNLTTGGGDSIGLGNETYAFNLTNSSVPDSTVYQLTGNYADNPLGSNLDDSAVVYLKFFLNAPAGQPAGTYQNNLSFKVVANGESP